MTNLFKKIPAKDAEIDPVEEAAQRRLEAARELTESIAAAGKAMVALTKAESEYNAVAATENQMRFAQQLFPFLIGEMNLNAPEMSRFLRLPHIAPSRCESIAVLVERQVKADLAEYRARSKEAAA